MQAQAGREPAAVRRERRRCYARAKRPSGERTVLREDSRSTAEIPEGENPRPYIPLMGAQM